MKLLTKLSLVLMLVFAASSVMTAQEYKTEVDLIQSTIGKSKKDFVTQMVNIPSDKADAFWTLYNAYETARKGFSQTRVGLVQKYVAAFNNSNLGDDEIKSLMKQVFKLDTQNEKLIKKYYKKIGSKVGHKTALQFFQVEEYLKNSVDGQILGNIPM